MEKYNFKKIYYNIATLTIISICICIFSKGFYKMFGPYSTLDQQINLDLYYIPGYLLDTGMRFFIAMIFSIIISIIYAVVAAKNHRMRKLLIPLLDIFQSIPVLGFLAFTVTAFVNLAPDNIFGVEMAVIFAIVTAQVWNIIFSVYQSLISVPSELYETAKIYKLNNWKIFWKIELPFALPGLLWNIILSMASSWFYVVTQEMISVGTQSYTMPGMGSYIALALQKMDLKAIIYAVLAIISLIVIFNELFFKPLMAWSFKFRYEFNLGANTKSKSWMFNYLQQASIICVILEPVRKLLHCFVNIKIPILISSNSKIIAIVFETLFWMFVCFALYTCSEKLYETCNTHIHLQDISSAFKLGFITAIRIIIMLCLCSLLWVPIGIFVGLRPKLALLIQPIVQFLTAIPANIYYPIFVISILHFHLRAEIWLSVMIVMGSQWYILYNVIAGAQNIPTELLESSKIFRLRLYNRLIKIIIPAIFPYYTTGLITAAGASWNASIVSEIMTWGSTTITATGLGEYITTNTISGNYPQIILGLIIMSIFVVSINHFILKPLYSLVSTKFRLD